MVEYLSKINLMNQAQYNTSPQSPSELYLVPDISDTVVTVSPVSDVYSLDLTSARNFTITTNDTSYKKITFTNFQTNETVIKAILLIDYAQAQQIYFAKTIWKDGVFPTLTVGKKYLINFESYDNGLTFFAKVLSDYDMTVAKDDFNRADGALSGALLSGQRWEIVNGVWDIASQKLKPSGTGSSKFVVADTDYHEGISVSSDIYVGGEIDAGLVVRFLDSSNYLQVSLNNSGQSRVQEVVNGIVESASVRLFSSNLILLGTTVNLKAELLNDEIKVYINNTLIGQKAYYKKTTPTKVGFKHYAGATVTFDNFVVKKL